MLGRCTTTASTASLSRRAFHKHAWVDGEVLDLFVEAWRRWPVASFDQRLVPNGGRGFRRKFGRVLAALGLPLDWLRGLAPAMCELGDPLVCFWAHRMSPW